MNQLRRIGLAVFGGGRQFSFEHRAHARRGTDRFFLADGAAHFVQAGSQQLLLVERRLAGEQFVEQHAQAVNVGPRVNVQAAQLGLFRAHVGGRANELLERRE